ncbi:MAG: hypothetical protein VR73_10815 [Gammaproteobacteria bacterium BRH_c0]|nr:MAG: hypothetical protein VR73_10815 [Gammaproteobacteria bacterium BRH_c0]
MTEQTPILADQLHQWLQNAGIEYYVCSHCNGLHLTDLQSLNGVVESRLFLEDWGLLLSTEFVVRPTALLPLAAELGRLNASYPTLKQFLDIVDDAMPQLVAGATILTGAGMSEQQFELFVVTARDLMMRLAQELEQLDYLLPEEGETSRPNRQFH